MLSEATATHRKSKPGTSTVSFRIPKCRRFPDIVVRGLQEVQYEA
jgi:hypothetical protein